MKEAITRALRGRQDPGPAEEFQALGLPSGAYLRTEEENFDVARGCAGDSML